MKKQNVVYYTNRYPAFQIYKEGQTDGYITILRDSLEFNMAEKIKFYRWLGYTVRLLDGTIL